jgi:flavin reductase (DIM6/NTAB) family NADH-FMN oxidoreductase RutF
MSPASLQEGSNIETDLTTLPWEAAYALLIGSVIPRPIAWVSTTSTQGVYNVAPFSFFNGFGANPVILGFAPMASNDRPQKDTLANVRACGEFVVNIVTESTLVKMDATGRPYPPDVDEFVVAGLTPAPSVAVKAPRIAESPINFECTLFSLIPLGDGDGSATLVLGRAVHVHIVDDSLREGKVDAGLLKPVARLGGPLYARPQQLGFRRGDTA